MAKKKTTEPVTEEQKRTLEELGLKAPKLKWIARDLIWYLERARIGMKDSRHFKERIAHVKQLQEELLGKQTRYRLDPDRLGTIEELQFGRTGLMSYYINWGEHSSWIDPKHCLLVT